MRRLFYTIFLWFWLTLIGVALCLLFVFAHAGLGARALVRLTVHDLLMFSVAGAIFCWFISRYLTAPLHKLGDAAAGIAEGRFETRVDPSLHGALAVGDEPLLLARVAPCWVGADRVAAAREAIAEGASVLVLDDGLQNPSLAKDYAIAVIDGEAGFGNGLCFPAGPLRAPPERQAPYVSAEVVIGERGSPPRAHGPAKPLFRARLEADAIVAAGLIGRPALAFAGIARPEKFFATLEAIGATVAGRRAFPDHYVYSARDIAELAAVANRRGLTLVTTEKDYVRLAAGQRAGVRALPVTLRFDAPERVAASLREALASFRARNRPPSADC